MWTQDYKFKTDTLNMVANTPSDCDVHFAVSDGDQQCSHRVPEDSLNADDNNVDDDKANSASLCHADLAIKLFGRDIPVTSHPMKAVKYEQEQAGRVPVFLISDVQFHSKQELGVEASSTDKRNGLLASDDLGSFSGNDGNEEGKLQEGIRDSQAISCSEYSLIKENYAHGHMTHDKQFKKPEKLLPCPRCNSLDTKFCYFNNYNANQPRHFCKNCQRYWTAGGMLRNVAIGAGRRKRKHCATHLRHTMHDFTAVRPDPNNSAHCSKSACSGGSRSNHLKIRSQPSRLQMLPLEASSLATLETPTTATSSFQQEAPICEIMAANPLNMHTKSGTETSAVAQGWNNPAGMAAAKDGNPDVKADHRTHLQSNSVGVFNRKSGGSQTASASIIDAVGQEHTAAGVVAEHAENTPFEKVPSFSKSGGPQQSHLHMKRIVAEDNAECDTVNVCSDASSAPIPNCLTWNGSSGGLWAGFPWPPMHMSLWGLPASECGSLWNIPWGFAAVMAAATSSAAAAAAATSSLVTNTNTTSERKCKHRLDGSQAEPSNDGCLLVPKTLRINDPLEAARSSIWTSLGLEAAAGPRKISCATAFDPKSETTVFEETSVQACHTNRAALSRSMAFQESI